MKILLWTKNEGRFRQSNWIEAYYKGQEGAALPPREKMLPGTKRCNRLVPGDGDLQLNTI